MTKDMTNGSPMKLILGFSIPLLFGYLFQQFYNLVDTLIVGRFLGVDALAAVGSTGSLNFLIIGFCMGVCNGLRFPWHINLVPVITKDYVHLWSMLFIYLQFLQLL